jgi:hypothetical protein
VADFAALAAVRHHCPVTVLDVRRDSEWDAAHINGAVHIPLHDLPGRISELPGGELWVHCQAGYRASVAAFILDAPAVQPGAHVQRRQRVSAENTTDRRATMEVSSVKPRQSSRRAARRPPVPGKCRVHDRSLARGGPERKGAGWS